MRFTEYVERRVDPRGKEYFWLYGQPKEAPPNTDVYVVFKESKIAITPLRLNLNMEYVPSELKELLKKLNEQ